MRLKRENYLKMIRPYYEADLIKVITGVRRAGKSVILESIRDELSESGIPEDHIESSSACCYWRRVQQRH